MELSFFVPLHFLFLPHKRFLFLFVLRLLPNIGLMLSLGSDIDLCMSCLTFSANSSNVIFLFLSLALHLLLVEQSRNPY